MASRGGTAATVAVAACLGLGLATALANGSDLRSSLKLTNLTVYHVNPISYGGIPYNMDTGDVTGDLYFILRSVVGPIECAENPSAEDCTDLEVVSPSLVATQLKMEVNSHFGRYGMCNICTPKIANSSLGRGCNSTLYGKYLCFGMMVNKNLVGFETVASAHGSRCAKGDPEWKCWRNHLVSKVGGNWWSFFNESYCTGGAAVGTKGCAWRVLGVQKTVNNTCLLGHVYTAIESYAPTSSCYSKCNQGAGPGRNISDPCWIKCTYTAVLGPNGGLPTGAIAGMPVADIEAGWNTAFSAQAQGGCPALT